MLISYYIIWMAEKYPKPVSEVRTNNLDMKLPGCGFIQTCSSLCWVWLQVFDYILSYAVCDSVVCTIGVWVCERRGLLVNCANIWSVVAPLLLMDGIQINACACGLSILSVSFYQLTLQGFLLPPLGIPLSWLEFPKLISWPGDELAQSFNWHVYKIKGSMMFGLPATD